MEIGEALMQPMPFVSRNSLNPPFFISVASFME